MKELAKIHDMCLEYELAIDSDVDMLAAKRIKAYESKDKEVFREILPALNAVIEDVEKYKDYILLDLVEVRKEYGEIKI